MDPISNSFPKNYADLPILSDNNYAELISNGRKMLLFHELLIDVTEFDHPGNYDILKPYINKKVDTAEAFQSFRHSENAEMLVCLKTVGRLADLKSNETIAEQELLEGEKVYIRVQSRERSRIHEQAIRKIDFSLPLIDQIKHLSPIEKQVMTQVPKLFSNPWKIKFRNTTFEEYLETTNFWVSTFTFQTIICTVLWYLFSTYGTEQILLSLPFFILGVMKWTLLEYYFHRFELHDKIFDRDRLHSHYMHHVFPNARGKIALSINRVILYNVAFFFCYSLILDRIHTIVLCLGIMVGLTLYDIVHYYCHFGPETNIRWVNYLKRNHLKHHYRDQNRGFGVTSTLWDRVFGTQHLKN